MFKSLASSLITLFVVIISGFVILFIWSGSEDIRFQRIALEGDRSLGDVVASVRGAETNSIELETSSDMKDPEPVAGMAGGGDKVVLWISIPGFRGDYIEEADADFFSQMISEGGSTTDLTPTFPCLTFPSHAALLTGTPSEGHGITMDRFRIDGAPVDAPDATHLLAEPIWKTATRQGIRTLVHDWPMSQNLPTDAAAISLPSFDASLTDQQRLDALMAAWEGDKDENKLRLLMIRLEDIINAGKQNGPRADETFDVVRATSASLDAFFKQVEEKWETLAAPGTSLSVVLTTDHGLAELTTSVNLEQLLTEQGLIENVDIITSGAIAHLYFKNLPENEGQQKLFMDNFDNEMKRTTYFRTISKDDVPDSWAYKVEGRVGDRILVLKSRYSFTDFKGEESVFAPSEGDGIFAAWGYPVESSVRMLGQAIIWGMPDAPTSGSLGEIDTTVFHSTVCKLLGIEPSPDAKGVALNVN